jgi:hypothetical protein
VDDIELDDAKLTDVEWHLTEILLVFLLSFQRYSARFECNSSQSEIDYIFFAYDAMYNHIDDVKIILQSNDDLGRLPYTSYFLTIIANMEETLWKYYIRTEFPTVYGDGMILNPRSKLLLFQEDTWDDSDLSQSYVNGARRRFIAGYSHSSTTSVDNTTSSSTSSTTSTSGRSKHTAEDDAEFQAMLLQRSKKRRRNDFDSYIEIANNPEISSSLEWWKVNQRMYPDLAKMARDVLAVPASGCAVERQFSISGRMASWQRSRLSPEAISDSMVFKVSIAHTRCPMRGLDLTDDDGMMYVVPEVTGVVPKEWQDKWWLEKLKRPVRAEIVELFAGAGDSEEEDLYDT